MHQRERSESIRDFMARSRRGLERLKPGVFIALVVTSVVGITGIVQWNQRLVIIGLLSGAALIAINIVAVLISHWHRRNTRLDASYASAEDVVRLRRPRR